MFVKNYEILHGLKILRKWWWFDNKKSQMENKQFTDICTLSSEVKYCILLEYFVAIYIRVVCYNHRSHCLNIVSSSRSSYRTQKSIWSKYNTFFLSLDVFIDHNINKYCRRSQLLNWPCYKAVGYMFGFCFVDVFVSPPL